MLGSWAIASWHLNPPHLHSVKGGGRFLPSLQEPTRPPPSPAAVVKLRVEPFRPGQFLHSAGHHCTNGKQPQLETCLPPGLSFPRSNFPWARARSRPDSSVPDTLCWDNFCRQHSGDNRVRGLKSLTHSAQDGAGRVGMGAQALSPSMGLLQYQQPTGGESGSGPEVCTGLGFPS